MLDLTPLLTLLSSLGPWGVLAGAGLTLLVQWLRNRPPATPTPTPTPDPLKPSAPATPILDALANLLKLLALKKAAMVVPVSVGAVVPVVDGDVDTETAKKLLAVILSDGIKG